MPSVFAPDAWWPGRQVARDLCRDLGPPRIPRLPGGDWAMELGDAIERRIAAFHGGVPADEATRSPRTALQRIVGPARRDPFGRQVAALEALYIEAAEREGLSGIPGKWRPMFPIIGFPQQMGDVLVGRTLVEVKCVAVRPAVAVYTGMTQLAWAYLNDRANAYRLNSLTIYLAMHGVFLRWTPRQLLRALCGRQPTAEEIAFWRGPSPEAITARRVRLAEIRKGIEDAIERARSAQPGAEFASWSASRAAEKLMGMAPEFPISASFVGRRDGPLDLEAACAAIEELDRGR